MQRRSQRSVTEMRRTLPFLNGVSGADGAAAEDLAEDPADGHDAVADEMEAGPLRVGCPRSSAARPAVERSPCGRRPRSPARRQARRTRPGPWPGPFWD